MFNIVLIFLGICENNVYVDNVKIEPTQNKSGFVVYEINKYNRIDLVVYNVKDYVFFEAIEKKRFKTYIKNNTKFTIKKGEDMRITDTSGTTIFDNRVVNSFDNYWNATRDHFYTSIDDLNSSSNIGDDYMVELDFLAMNRTELNNLNTIFKTNRTNNASITSLDNYDEVISGETYTTYSGNVYIETKSFPKPKKTINIKDIESYNVRLKFRFDTISTATK